MHTEDGRLRRVDHGRAEEGAEHAAVGDGEGAARHILQRQSAFLCLVAVLSDGLLNILINTKSNYKQQ